MDAPRPKHPRPKQTIPLGSIALIKHLKNLPAQAQIEHPHLQVLGEGKKPIAQSLMHPRLDHPMVD